MSNAPDDDRRTQLEQRALEVRSRLERRLDVIDERRQQLVEFARAATRPPVSVVLAASCGVAAAILIAQRVRSRRRHGPAWARVLGARPEPRAQSLIVKGLQNVALSLLTLTLRRIGTRGLERLRRTSSQEQLPQIEVGAGAPSANAES